MANQLAHGYKDISNSERPLDWRKDTPERVEQNPRVTGVFFDFSPERQFYANFSFGRMQSKNSILPSKYHKMICFYFSISGNLLANHFARGYISIEFKSNLARSFGLGTLSSILCLWASSPAFPILTASNETCVDFVEDRVRLFFSSISYFCCICFPLRPLPVHNNL